MMKRIFAWLLALLVACMPVAACADDDEQEIIGDILAWLSGGVEIQEWIDTSLAAGAGGSTDAVVPFLLRLGGEYDFSKYAQALSAKLDSGIKSAVTRQRAGLILSYLGEKDRLSDSFADETIGELGVMSYIFGLHLLNNGFKSKLWTIDSLIDKLGSMQLDDGGWAVSGQYSDPDVTAMCLQALAECEVRSDDCENMLKLAVAYLSKVQNEDGSYSSYGSPTCESCAQVIIALNSLDIDPMSDGRFIKNGNTIRDAMLGFRLEDGSFCHIQEDKANTMACIQALGALVSLQQPDISFYDFSDFTTASATKSTAELPVWKLIAWGTIALLGVIGTIVSLLKQRGKLKRLLLVLILCAIGAFAVFSINIESAESYYSDAKSDKPISGQVWLSIACETVAGLSDDGSTPKGGVILPRTQIEFNEGDSAFDVLTHAVRKYGIHMEHTGATGDLIYVNGINNLYEYAYGDLSGWIYLVNGQQLSLGCGSYNVADGDEIRWEYTLKLGEDFR